MLGKSDGSIIIDINLDDKDYESRLKRMETKTKSFGTQLKALLSAVGITKALSAGFHTLENSIGSAMKRIDTMAQFDRVMTTMTGSTKKAEKALEDLKGITKGTAYGLDVAAASTQKLVTSGMNLDKAVPQIKTWGDAVAFYGDGSNETFAGVTDAIAKMTSKGTVEMDQLNRLFDAGIPAVEIYASYVGRSAQSVQEDLSDGVISAQEFTNGLTKAMQDGTQKFASIDGAAKEAGASWSATFDNMHAAVARGMVNIIESIDEALTSNGLPTMREMIASVGKAFEQTLTFVADHIPELISLLERLAPYVVAIGTAFASWKITSTVGKASKSVSDFLNLMGDGVGFFDAFLLKASDGSGAFSKIASSAIDADGGIKGLGSALMTAMGGPVGIAVAAIAALVAAFIYLWNTSDEFRQFCYDLWDGIVDFFSGIADSIVKFFTETIPKAWDNFKNKMSELCQSIVQWFRDAWNGIISFFTETIPSWIQSVIDWFNELPYRIGYMVGQIIGQFIQWGIDLKNFVTTDIPEFIRGVVDWFLQLPGKIWDALCDAWDRLKTWGINIYDTAKEWIGKTIINIVEWFQSLPGKIWNWLCRAVDKVMHWGADIYNAASRWVSDTVSNIIDWFISLPGKIYDVGVNMIKGLWDGIVSVKDWIFDKIDSFCDGMVDGLLDFFGIHSPSRLLRDTVGKFLPPGIAVGFKIAMPKSTKDILNEMDQLNGELQKQVDATINDVSVPLETNAKISQQQSIVNAFPKTMRLLQDGNTQIRLVLENGEEIAHWLAPSLNTELATLR